MHIQTKVQYSYVIDEKIKLTYPCLDAVFRDPTKFSFHIIFEIGPFITYQLFKN